eukprot:Gb_27735 [translate_table: standard]
MNPPKQSDQVPCMRKRSLRQEVNESEWESERSYGDGHMEEDNSSWSPRSYACMFCRRGFPSAQALGGHMNVHRRDRARLRGQSMAQHDNVNIPPPAPPNYAVMSTACPCLVYPLVQYEGSNSDSFSFMFPIASDSYSPMTSTAPNISSYFSQPSDPMVHLNGPISPTLEAASNIRLGEISSDMDRSNQYISHWHLQKSQMESHPHHFAGSLFRDHDSVSDMRSYHIGKQAKSSVKMQEDSADDLDLELRLGERP